MEKSKPKIIVIAGPTSAGKSDVAIKLACEFGGEIISADSRQIYRGMDIGSGKVARDFPSLKSKCKSQNAVPTGRQAKLQFKIQKEIYYSQDIPHYLIDIANPKTDFNVAKFKKKADKIIPNILKRGKLPIICGGTGFWVKALIDNIDFPKAKPDWKLREKLEKKSAEKLFETLEKLDARRAENIDRKNKARLIRAIEIAKALGKVPEIPADEGKYETLQIGISVPKEKLRQKIKTRLEKRFKQGMVAEVKKLHFENKVSWKRLENFGLEYRWIARYLQNKTSLKEMKENLYKDSKDYAKRQMTWFKKDKRIKWIGNYKEIKKEVEFFYTAGKLNK